VAGGGSLISFPTLALGLGLDDKIANATNSVGLWPGSLGGAFGFRNLFPKTAPYLKRLLLPTLIGSLAGAELLVHTDKATFRAVVPILILLAAVLLLFQKQIKAIALKEKGTLSPPMGIALQFLVSMYGGYFGAGIGIMMLAVFALYMEGTIHELNAIKSWLTTVVNFSCSVLFLAQGMINVPAALVLTAGSIVGGFLAARVSQRFDPERMRLVIAVYGVSMALYYAWTTYA